jgi:hypothetical protein
MSEGVRELNNGLIFWFMKDQEQDPEILANDCFPPGRRTRVTLSPVVVRRRSFFHSLFVRYRNDDRKKRNENENRNNPIVVIIRIRAKTNDLFYSWHTFRDVHINRYD